MKKTFENILVQITRPSRYLGTEINSVHKDLDRMAVKVLLAFPDLYEVGMSHLGIQILYHVLNIQEDVGAERVFAPWTDMEKILRKRGLPLLSLESRRPISTFDIIGFSLQYELSYTNVLNMLDLGKIPLRSKDRNEDTPLIIGGGPCAFNPEPVAEFFDAFVIGEGEEVILEVIAVFKQWRKARGNRDLLLDMLTNISGVYVPSKFEVRYLAQGSIQEVIPLKSGYNKIKKRIVSNLDQAEYPTDFIVPFTPIIHDRINLEIARGCTRSCRFCQAGMIYRPVRERSCSTLERIAEKSLECTGWEEVSLLSLSSGDYSEVEELLYKLINKFSGDNIAISLPSLRAETLQSNLINAVKKVRKTGFTIAPEAGTDRLRRVINKGITESEILETCQRVFSAGWRSIKLYFMVGLPTETKEDLDGIIQLSEKVWAQGKGIGKKWHVNVSVATFIPKPHTPFQWASMIPAEEIKFRQAYLHSRLKRHKFNFRWQDPYTSVLEGIMARGDRRLSKVIEEAFRNGARFDGWRECFNYQIWEKAFQKMGLDSAFYLNKREESEIFPWNHIDSGVKKEFLWKEFNNSSKEVEILDCRFNECQNCGVCDFKSIYPRIEFNKNEKNKKEANDQKIPSSAEINKVRLQFSKTEEARFLSHLEMSKVFARAVRRAKLPLKYTQGYHPQPRIIFGPPLPVGFESLAEFVDIELWDRIPVENLKAQLNRELPQGITVIFAKEIPLKTPAISDSVYEVSYAISVKENSNFKKFFPGEIERVIKKFLSRPSFLIKKNRRGEVVSLDIRPMIKDMVFIEDKDSIELTLRFPQAQSIRPDEIIGALWNISETKLKDISICKTNMKLKEKWAQT